MDTEKQNFRAGLAGQSAQRLSKEEMYHTEKAGEEEIWGMIDGKAQEVFQNENSLKGFCDFMGQCKRRGQTTCSCFMHRIGIRQVKTFEKWKGRRQGSQDRKQSYNFIVGQEYEKGRCHQQEYSIQKAYDISQIRTKRPRKRQAKADGPADGSTADRQRGTDSDHRQSAG